ncbi:hypothetical protein VTK73DRAFT_6652 [Phialemonium thermophilum]|uniref:Iron-sulfur cluster assembly factor IBA57 homolog, mitochondrial n=1 Tax=Phialemonium thermophilum TaxID=223376 RepID=A0ABR3WIZ6_9PEZI
MPPTPPSIWNASGLFLSRSFVCRSCLLDARRTFSSVNHDTPAPPPPAGISRLSSRRLISVSGPDAAKYLQGVITSSITGPDGSPRPPGSGFYTAFLSAQGRVLHDVFVYPAATLDIRGDPSPKHGESFLIEVDAAEAERLQAHIRRYKLRAKFAVRLLDAGEWTVWQAWSDDAAQADAAATAPKKGSNFSTTSGGTNSVVIRDPRLPALGYRILAPRDDVPVGMNLEETPETAYQIRRYLQGVPEGQSELIRDQALPLESNMDIMGGIDFHKGCYVGQELTIRTKHRGVVRKRVLPCVLYGGGGTLPTELAYRPGDEATALAARVPSEASIGRMGRKARSPGKWLRGVGNVGLALCRLEIMTDIVLPGETAASAYDPDAEFVISEAAPEEGTGGDIRVKAFVPSWLRQGLDLGQPH